MQNLRIIRSFFTGLGFFKKMGQLGPPKPPFFSLDKNNLFHQYFLFRLGYLHAKFYNNLVNFDLFKIFKK